MQHTQYISTRGQMAPAGFTDVLVAGLAPDGGLAVPSQLPALSPEQIEAWRPLGYADLATEVIGLFATDIPREDLAELTQADLAPQWGEDMIEAHAATAQEAALLSVPEGAPTLDITRRTFHEHCAIDYSRTLFRADRYTLWVPVAAPKPAFRPDRSSS